MTTTDQLRATADEIDAGDWYNVNPPTYEWSSALREAADIIEAERVLADDLALALRLSIKYGRPPKQAAEAMERYRAARGR